MDLKDNGSSQRPGDHWTGLMARYQEGDAAAFESIYGEASSLVERYLRRMAPANVVPDLVQETFLHVIRARHTYRPDSPFVPWLLAVARHTLLQSRRRFARRWSKEIGMDAYPERATASSSDPLDSRRVEEALERLAPEQRELAWLAWVEGFTSPEISRITGLSAGAVKVRLHRMAKRLRAEEKE
jgi:RNA polymerase sigma-70 factor (ECF subfamily)